MIELVLVVFLFSVLTVATVAVRVGFRAVDYIETAQRFYRKIEEQQAEIIRLLQEAAKK